MAMWIFTKLGFFSVVQKPDDHAEGTLTIRSRVRADLEALRTEYIPTLGSIIEHAGTDYRYRAKASRTDVQAAMAKIVGDITYSNFKNEVAKQQGKSRAATYGKVWSALYPLQAAPANHAITSTASKAGNKAIAYGGILVNGQGC
jgi:hypothetical protein